jgi:hypothetical protein
MGDRFNDCHFSTAAKRNHEPRHMQADEYHAAIGPAQYRQALGSQCDVA